MKQKLIAGLIIALLAFALGWLPERSKRVQAEDQTFALSNRLDATGQALVLTRFRSRAALCLIQSERGEYDEASKTATQLFTDVRTFIGSQPEPLRQRLEKGLANRDAIIAGLAKADPNVKDQIRDLFLALPAE